MTNLYREKKYVVSACLAGVECRYDCKSNARKEIQELIEQGIAIPVCPEQLGGLPTPRTPAERLGSNVITAEGNDVTEQYVKGAQEALKIAQLFGATEALLKSKSPMCGVGRIYNGKFNRQLIEGDGVFTEFLKSKNINVSEAD